ncbi:hypothetical protein BG004_007812 [Podila humilis]|nr:hypothetical protein BG004_007812 [Podila humilis]
MVIDSSIIQIGIVLGLPYLIRFIRSIFVKTPQQPSPFARKNAPAPSKSTWAQSTTILLLLMGIYHLSMVAFFNPPNIFQTFALAPESPNFLLHQTWKEHAEADPGFMDRYPGTLRERFKSHENRFMYLVFGHDAFLNCEHCTESSDYIYYLIPTMASSYLVMAVALGMATTQISHLTKYRTWGVVFLVIIAVAEYITLSQSMEAGNLAGLKQNVQESLLGYRGASLVRHLLLSVMSFGLSFFLHRNKPGSGPRDEIEMLTDLCQAQEAMIQRHRALHLARIASLRDPLLRKQFVEYWKRREVEHGLLVSDPEYKDARDLALSRIDVEALTREATEYIDAIVRSGERNATTEADESLTKTGQEQTTSS